MKVMTVEDVLKEKAIRGTLTASVHDTMRDVVGNLAKNNIGAMVVCDESRPVGIVTERDILRLLAQHGACFLTMTAAEVMTRDIVIGTYDDSIETIKHLMTSRRFRHVPIMHQGKLVGIISIGDVVRSQLDAVKSEARYLIDYIAGYYP